MELHDRLDLKAIVQKMNGRTLSVFLKGLAPRQIAKLQEGGHYGMKANIPDSIVVTDQYLDPNNPQVAFENIKERSDWHNKDAEERKCAFRPAMVMDGSVRPGWPTCFEVRTIAQARRTAQSCRP